MSNNREQVAWAIMLVSFTLCIGLIVGTPLGIRSMLNNARSEQDALLEPQQGTPRLQRHGRGPLIALVVPTWDVPAGSAVTTDENAEGLLTVYAPGPELNATAWVKVYGNTELRLMRANSPVFETSPLPHQVGLGIYPLSAEADEAGEGRVRISVAAVEGRNTVVQVVTPHLIAELGEGSYEVRVRTASSEISVREGSAHVHADGGTAITLGSSQRTVADANSQQLLVLPGERNLLTNGNFTLPLIEGWQAYNQGGQDGSTGLVEVTELAGRPAAHFSRDGIGHAEVGIMQEVDYDVQDFNSLSLHLVVQVRGQSLPGCGSLGSECPIIVRIDYKDIYGTDRQWYWGFYSQQHVPPDLLQPWEEQIPLQTWVTFDSDNLIEQFEEPPALVKTVTIYASGHSFDALVTEVELLAQE